MSGSFNCNRDTIAALATGAGNSALAIIRISGFESFSLLAQALPERDRFMALAPRTIHIFSFVDTVSNADVDQITLIKYVAPASYTGEEMVEIFCHGGQIVIQKILEVIFVLGIRYARRGEFTHRALLNGKMDLIKAESIHALITSTSQAQHHVAMAAYRGNYQGVISSVRDQLAKTYSLVEAAIEFPEEDDIAQNDLNKSVFAAINQLVIWIAGQIDSRKRLKKADSGYTIAIAGIPNAGKSTLFNMLLGVERSLVHWQSGTTRDWVSETAILGGVKVTLVDTAGVHTSNNEVEMMGIDRSWNHIENADLLLWVTPANSILSSEEEELLTKRGSKPMYCVINKIDLGDAGQKSAFCLQRRISALQICAQSDEASSTVLAVLEKEIAAQAPVDTEQCVVFSDRQEQALLLAQHALSILLNNQTIGLEIQAIHLREALSAIEEFAGITTTDQILNAIFDSFCVGK